MLQNKQPLSLPSPRRFGLLLAIVAIGLCLAVVNFERARAQQPTANTNAAQQKARPKRLTPLRTSDTADGSRVTITSDGELNDYSAYRSGDRFIVVVPQAEGAGAGGARGRGFEGAQVEKRGKDLVYTFKLQPGATARVNQRFNRLDVQFSAAKDGARNATTPGAKPTPAPAATPAKRTLAEEAGITKPPTNANAQATPDARRATDANANAALATATPFANATPNAETLAPVSGTQPGAIATPTLAPATPGADQIAQAQQPVAAPPVSITTGAPSTVAPTSVGAIVIRNWPWLLAALVAIGLGFIFVSRLGGGDRDKSRSLPPATPAATKPVTTFKETKTAELKPASAATVPTASANITNAGATTAAATNETTAATTTTTGSTAASAATGATAATAASLAASGKQSKKKKKKAEKAKRLASTSDVTAGGATTTDAGAIAAGGAGAATGAIIAGASALGGATAETKESKAGEAKVTGAKAAETKAVEPSIAFDPERIEAEIKKLLAGESYDESIINATHEGTRQLVSAELMSAIVGRHAARQTHARTAFLKHGYFEEAARALQSAEAPGERAAAARTLGLLGNRNATPHLTAALEDPAADVRRTSVEALAELRDPAAVDAPEALRWRETSRQVPRALIQRAVEASKEAAAAAEVEDNDTPMLITTRVAGVAPTEIGIEQVATTEVEAKETATEKTATAETATREAETKELEVAALETSVIAEEITVAAVVAEESDATVQEPQVESPVLAAPDASVAVEEVATVETILADDETKIVEVREAKAFAFTAPHVEPATAMEEVTAEVETPTIETPATHAETDLAATLAAKEASLIEARRRQAGEKIESAKTSKAVESFVASPAVESPATSFEGDAPAPVIPATQAEDASPQPIYVSDFAAGSGQPTVGDGDWIDLDADEHGVTIHTVDAAVAAASPAEAPGPFFAEEAIELSAPHAPEAQGEETVSLFDSVEVEAFETNAAVEPAPVVVKAVKSAHFEDAETKPLTFGHRPSSSAADDESPRGTGVVKAEKGLSIVDGSDEDTYSIIPKGIQLRLASDDASERAASVLALSRLNTDEAFNQICAAFDDPVEEVRNAAARAIYDLNEDRADSFTRALRESPVERRRQIGAALAGSGLADEAVGNLTGESRDKTYDAFSLLFLMAKAGEVAPLIRAIESHPDSEVRLAVVKLLALSGQHDILPSFRRLAVRGSLPTEVRSAVMEAIYQISSQPQNTTPAT